MNHKEAWGRMKNMIQTAIDFSGEGDIEGTPEQIEGKLIVLKSLMNYMNGMDLIIEKEEA